MVSLVVLFCGFEIKIEGGIVVDNGGTGPISIGYTTAFTKSPRGGPYNTAKIIAENKIAVNVSFFTGYPMG